MTGGRGRGLGGRTGHQHSVYPRVQFLKTELISTYHLQKLVLPLPSLGRSDKRLLVFLFYFNVLCVCVRFFF